MEDRRGVKTKERIEKKENNNVLFQNYLKDGDS